MEVITSVPADPHICTAGSCIAAFNLGIAIGSYVGGITVDHASRLKNIFDEPAFVVGDY